MLTYLVRKVFKSRKASKVHKVNRVFRVFKAHRAKLVREVNRVFRGFKEKQVRKALPARLALTVKTALG